MFRALIVFVLLFAGAAQAQAGGFGAGLLLGRAFAPRQRVVFVDRGFDTRGFDDCGSSRAFLRERAFERQLARERAFRIRGSRGCN